MQLSRRVDAAAVGVLAVGALAGVLLWPELPERMAVHWSGGDPDSYVSKPVAVFGIAALGAAAIAFARLAPDSVTNTPGGENAAVLFVGVVFAWIQGMTYAWNLGYRFDVWLAAIPVLAGAAGLVWYAGRRS